MKEYTLSVKNVCLVGKMRSGKDTVFGMLKELDPTYERFAFADQVKLEASERMGVTVDAIAANKEVFRPFLQWLGTDFWRVYHGTEDRWISYLDMELAARPDARFVVTDCRFINEAEFCRRNDFVVIRVLNSRTPQGDTALHASEVELDAIQADVVIDNNGTLDDLRLKVNELYFSYLRGIELTV